MTALNAVYCTCCRKLILAGQPRAREGVMSFCTPDGSDCHVMGAKTAGWRLTENEARTLLYADVDALRRVGSRNVDHPDAAFGEGAEHVAA